MLTSVLPLALQAADRRDRRLAVVRNGGSASPAGKRARHDRCPHHAAWGLISLRHPLFFFPSLTHRARHRPRDLECSARPISRGNTAAAARTRRNTVTTTSQFVSVVRRV